MWQTSRFECKYMIPGVQVNAVRKWIQMFLPPDAFSAKFPDLVYSIGSLYLDSPNRRLYMGTEHGEKNRFKLRIRSYSDDPSTPLFLEIKRRIDRVIRKTRVKLTRADTIDILTGQRRSHDVASGESVNHIETFLGLMSGMGAGPVARVRYKREAYESTSNDRVRLTLDSALSAALTQNHNFSLETGDWRFPPMEGTLLEVKFTDYYPRWIAEMIRHFELHKIPFSKYCLSINELISPLDWSRRWLEGA